MDLAKRGRVCCFALKARKTALPIGPQFGAHPPLDKGPAHGGRIGLKRCKLFGVFRGQEVGNGGQYLGHLHQWPTGFSKGLAQRNGYRLVGIIAASQPLGSKSGCSCAHVHPNTGDPAEPAT